STRCASNSRNRHYGGVRGARSRQGVRSYRAAGHQCRRTSRLVRAGHRAGACRCILTLLDGASASYCFFNHRRTQNRMTTVAFHGQGGGLPADEWMLGFSASFRSRGGYWKREACCVKTPFWTRVNPPGPRAPFEPILAIALGFIAFGKPPTGC